MYQLRNIPEVSISMRMKGEEVRILAGGRVGWLEAGVSVQLIIWVPADSAIWAIGVDGKKDIVLRRDKSNDPGLRIYPTRIAIKESEVSGVAHTEYPNNHVRLLHYVGNGNVEHWEIALVSQNGYFWVTVQKTYDIKVGCDGEDHFLCPDFADKWPQLVGILGELLAGFDLPEEVTPMPKPMLPVSGLKTNEGLVFWWNCAQQMGAITTRQGPARVHWSQITISNGDLAKLVDGAKVRFRDLVRPKQTEFGRKTSFKWEAVDVRPL